MRLAARLVPVALVAGSVWVRPDIAVALVVLGLPFAVIERWRPVRAQPSAFRRVGGATDAAAFIVDEVVAAAVLACVAIITLRVADLSVPRQVGDYVGSRPGWARWSAAFVVAEISGYWGHRLSHEIPMLWRFHRVHHSSPQLDWLAPNRRHLVDVVVARASTSVPVLLLGLAAPAVVTWFALRRIQGLFVHANLDLRLGPLERVIATPFFHHWHHSDEPGTWNTNYAGSLPVVDWLFGTLHLPPQWPRRYGCDGAVPHAGYLARLASPWTRPARSVEERGDRRSGGEGDHSPD